MSEFETTSPDKSPEPQENTDNMKSQRLSGLRFSIRQVVHAPLGGAHLKSWTTEGQELSRLAQEQSE